MAVGAVYRPRSSAGPPAEGGGRSRGRGKGHGKGRGSSNGRRGGPGRKPGVGGRTQKSGASGWGGGDDLVGGEDDDGGGGGGDDNIVEVDPDRAKALLLSWLQRSEQAQRPSEHVTVECTRGRRGHSCTVWVWKDEQWCEFEANGFSTSKAEAIGAAYASAVHGLEIPVPPEYALSEERRRARNSEERRRRQAVEQRSNAIASACREVEMAILKALFPSSLDRQEGGFRTPRETEDETMPEPLPPRLPLPPLVEAKVGEDRGNKCVQQLKALAKKEAQLLSGPQMFEAQTSSPGNPQLHVCAYAFLFDRQVAVLGTAWGTKRNAVRSA